MSVLTAIITPFEKDRQIDEQGFRFLLHRQMEAKVDGVVVLGTTGEASALSLEERKMIITIAKEELTVPLIVGCGGTSTEESLEKALLAKKLGAKILLVSPPYYVKPTQEGLFYHFETIAKRVNLPILLYNVPGRTGINLQPKTVEKLSHIETIVGIKETFEIASHQGQELIERIASRRKNFSFFAGDDIATLPFMALGAHGVISVMSNLLPQKMKELVQACQKNRFEMAREIHYELLPLFRGAFVETNPIPIKAMMQLVNLPAGTCRAPLTHISSSYISFLKELISPWFNETLISLN